MDPTQVAKASARLIDACPACWIYCWASLGWRTPARFHARVVRHQFGE